MDITTVPCGTETRNSLAKYRDREGYANYDEALNALLDNVNKSNR